VLLMEGLIKSQLYYITASGIIQEKKDKKAGKMPKMQGKKREIIDRTSAVGEFPCREGVFRRSA